MPNDLGGPEKPIAGIDWSSLVAQSKSPATAARPLYSPDRVRPRHRIAVMLHEAGWQAKDIAAALGYTIARVSVILNSHNPVLQELRSGFASQVADSVLDVNSRLKMYANEMLTVLVAHARNKDKPELSARSARDILHMAGFSPVKKVFQANTDVPLEELKQLTQHISDANEVVLSREKWSVVNPNEQKKEVA